MKKIVLKILILLLLTSSFVYIAAEDEYEDMKPWQLKILLQNCDQKQEIKVVRYYNNVTDKVGFCIEPEVNYNRFDYVYTKDSYPENEVFNIVRAYNEYNDEEHFISAQLMIWEAVSGNVYTFEGKDASDFGKDDLLTLIEGYKQDDNTINEKIDVKAGQENTYSFEDLSSYTIESDDVTITDKSDTSFAFTINDPDKEDNHIFLRSRIRRGNGAFLYHSEGSQDLYSYEGDYSNKKDIDLKLDVSKEEYVTLNFSKKDTSGNCIAEAEFTLFDLESDSANETMYILQKDKNVDLFRMLVEDYPNYDLNKVEISLSERFEKYLDGTIIKASETGVFPFTIRYNGNILKEGKVFVFEDPNQTMGEYRKLKVRKITSVLTANDEINHISDVKKGHKYYLCETRPSNGYEYASDPCKIINTADNSYETPVNFINSIRNYTLKLVKNDPDHIYKLNGARFEMEYEDGKELKRIEFVTGALNITQTKDRKYVIYRYEGSDEVNVEEFKNAYFIKENVPYGRYYYYLANEPDIDLNKLKNKYIDVSEGSYTIQNIPYDSAVSIKELKAPNGYIIDPDVYKLVPDISYDEVTYKNSRVNTALIIPENRRKIPKTCIED